MAKSRRNKNGVNGAESGKEDQEEGEEVMLVENSEGEEEGARSPTDVDSGHETAEEAMQVPVEEEVVLPSSRRGKSRKKASTPPETIVAVTTETIVVSPMEEDGEDGEDGEEGEKVTYVVKASAQDSMTESKTEAITASNGRTGTVTTRREVVVSQSTSTPKLNPKLKRTLEQIEELDKTEETWEKRPKTDYTYSHTGIYMRHADDLFNASESIIAPVDIEAAASAASAQALAASAAAAAATTSVSNGTTVKSVKMKSSALTPGRSRAVTGGAWGKVEVKTSTTSNSKSSQKGAAVTTNEAAEGEFNILSPNLSRRRLHKSDGLYSASNLRHLYHRCSLCAMARSRFPADEFGMDFHISHLQFYQPEASESEDDDDGGGGGGQQHVDLETALQLSIAARQRIRDSISLKSSAEASSRLVTTSSSSWSSSARAFAPSGECVMETCHVYKDGAPALDADVSDNEDGGYQAKSTRYFSSSSSSSFLSILAAFFLYFFHLIWSGSKTLVKGAAFIAASPILGVLYLRSRFKSDAGHNADSAPSLVHRIVSILAFPFVLAYSWLQSVPSAAGAATNKAALFSVDCVIFLLHLLRAFFLSLLRLAVLPITVFSSLLAKSSESSVLTSLVRGISTIFTHFFFIPVGILYQYLLVKPANTISGICSSKYASYLKFVLLFLMVILPPVFLLCYYLGVYSLALLFPITLIPLAKNDVFHSKVGGAANSGFNAFLTGLTRFYDLTKSLLVGLFALIIGAVYYSYKLLLYFPFFYLLSICSGVSSASGSTWAFVRRAAVVSAAAIAAAAAAAKRGSVALNSYLAWQCLFFVETVVTVTKALIWGLGVVVAFPFVGGYRLSKYVFLRLRSISGADLLSGLSSGISSVASKSSLLVFDGVKNLFSFVFFILFSCCYFLLWVPLHLIGERAASLSEGACRGVGDGVALAWRGVGGGCSWVWQIVSSCCGWTWQSARCIGAKLVEGSLASVKNLCFNGIYLIVGLLYVVLLSPVIFLWSQLSRLKSSSSSSSSSFSVSEDFSDVESENGLGSMIVSFFNGLLQYGVVTPLTYLYRLATFVVLFLTFPLQCCFGRLFSSRSSKTTVISEDADVVIMEEEPEVVPVAEISISSAPAKAKAILVGSAPTNVEEEQTVEVEVAKSVRTTRSGKVYAVVTETEEVPVNRETQWKTLCCWLLPLLLLLLLLLLIPLSGLLGAESLNPKEPLISAGVFVGEGISKAAFLARDGLLFIATPIWNCLLWLSSSLWTFVFGGAGFPDKVSGVVVGVVEASAATGSWIWGALADSASWTSEKVALLFGNGGSSLSAGLVWLAESIYGLLLGGLAIFVDGLFFVLSSVQHFFLFLLSFLSDGASSFPSLSSSTFSALASGWAAFYDGLLLGCSAITSGFSSLLSYVYSLLLASLLFVWSLLQVCWRFLLSGSLWLWDSLGAGFSSAGVKGVLGVGDSVFVGLQSVWASLGDGLGSAYGASASGLVSAYSASASGLGLFAAWVVNAAKFLGLFLYDGLLFLGSLLLSLWHNLFLALFASSAKAVTPAPAPTPVVEAPAPMSPAVEHVKIVGMAAPKCCGPTLEEINELIATSTKSLILAHMSASSSKSDAAGSNAAMAASTDAAMATLSKDLESKVALLIAASVTSNMASVKEEVKGEVERAKVEASKQSALVEEAQRVKVEAQVLAQAEASVAKAKADLESAMNARVLALQTEITQLKEDRDQAIAAAAASATAAATAAATAPSSDSDSSSSSSESVAAIAAITSSTQAIEAKLAVLTAQHDNVIRSLDALDGKVEDERVKLPAIEDAMRASLKLGLSKMESQYSSLQSTFGSLEEKQLSVSADLTGCSDKADAAMAAASAANTAAESAFAAIAAAAVVTSKTGSEGEVKVVGPTAEELRLIVKEEVSKAMSALTSEDGDSALRIFISNADTEKDAAFTAKLAAFQSEIAASVAGKLEALKAESDDAIAAASEAAKTSCGEIASTSASAAVASASISLAQPVVDDSLIKAVVREELKLFAADRTGLADFALESAGGSILSTRCSETYTSRSAMITLLGFPVWYSYNSPRTVIQPEMHPGSCWAFRGSEGFLVIQLANKVSISAFTYEHIPQRLSPSDNIDSAPNNFAVYGLGDENDTEGMLLGEYEYKIPPSSDEPLQTFPVETKTSEKFSVVELRINSNHGNPELTCLYRFRVHGTL